MRLHRADGVQRDLDLVATADFLPGSHLVVLRDVTDRKQLEAQLRQSQKMEAIGRLAGGVAHDFNNLLSVIAGYAELILRGLPADSPQRGKGEEILKASARAAALTRQLLAFSRQQVLQPKIFDLNAVVSEMQAMLERLIGVDIILDTRLDPHLGRVRADPGQVEQVVMNLVVNARDAMPDGGRIALDHDQRRDGRRLRPRAPRVALRPLRAARGQRQRARDGRRDAGPHLRAVLHHQGEGKGHRASGWPPPTAS